MPVLETGSEVAIIKPRSLSWQGFEGIVQSIANIFLCIKHCLLVIFIGRVVLIVICADRIRLT